jgi:hypothetical protein
MSTDYVSLDDLFKRYLPETALRTFAGVDVTVTETPSRGASLDELAEEILPQAVKKAIPEIDLEVKEFGLSLENEGFRIRMFGQEVLRNDKFRLHMYGRGITLTLFLLALVTLIVSCLN